MRGSFHFVIILVCNLFWLVDLETILMFLIREGEDTQICIVNDFALFSSVNSMLHCTLYAFQLC